MLNTPKRCRICDCKHNGLEYHSRVTASPSFTYRELFIDLAVLHSAAANARANIEEHEVPSFTNQFLKIKLLFANPLKEVLFLPRLYFVYHAVQHK